MASPKVSSFALATFLLAVVCLTLGPSPAEDARFECHRLPPPLVSGAGSVSAGSDDRVTLRIARGGNWSHSRMRVGLNAPQLGYLAVGGLCGMVSSAAEEGGTNGKLRVWVATHQRRNLGERVIFVLTTAAEYRACGTDIWRELCDKGRSRGCCGVAMVRPRVPLPFHSRSHAFALDKISWPAYLPSEVTRVLTLDADTEFAFDESLARAWRGIFGRFVPGHSVMGAAVEPSLAACRFGSKTVRLGFNSGVVAWDLRVLRALAPPPPPAPPTASVPRRLGLARAPVAACGATAATAVAAAVSGPREATQRPSLLLQRQRLPGSRKRRQSVTASPPPWERTGISRAFVEGQRNGEAGSVERRAGSESAVGVDSAVDWWWRLVSRERGNDTHSLGDQNVFNFFAALRPDRFAVLPCEVNFGQAKWTYLTASLGLCTQRAGEKRTLVAARGCCVPRSLQCRALPQILHWNGVSFEPGAMRAALDALADALADGAAPSPEKAPGGQAGGQATFAWANQCPVGRPEPETPEKDCCMPGANLTVCSVNASRIHYIRGED